MELKLFQGKQYELAGNYSFKYRAVDVRDKLLAKGFYVRIQKMTDGWKVFYRK